MHNYNYTLPNQIQTPSHSNNPLNPIAYSPSTTHMSLLLTKQKFTPTKQDKKANDDILKQQFPHPYQRQPKQQQHPCLNSIPFLQLSKVKQNLNKKFTNEEGIDQIISKENKESNTFADIELISKSNSQSSINEEKTLIENLTQKEYLCSYSKKSKSQSSKKVSYEGTIEFSNEHTGIIDQFKTFKENEVWVKPINDNLLLYNEEDDESKCSDEEVLTQSTQCVIKELCDGINQLNKDFASQDKKRNLLSRDMY